MSEELTMLLQENEKDEYVVYPDIPYFLIENVVGSSERSRYLQEFDRIRRLYAIYKAGSVFVTEGSNGDYVPSSLRFKKSAMIIDKEARFFFANPPTFNVNENDVDEEQKEKNAIVQRFLDRVLERNNFNGCLLKSAKDCFIGKRVAIVVNFNKKNGITTTFLNSTEFVYEFSGQRDDDLVKFASFYLMNDTDTVSEQEWFFKVYEKDDSGVYVREEVWYGDGEFCKTLMKRTKIKLDYIPAVVILNDGLTGETRGVSELGKLVDYEKYYSRLANADIDALRKSMNPIRYAIDASSASTKKLPISPGSFWDIQSDDEKSEEKVAKIGMMEADMNYSSPLKVTLDRIENEMYEEVDVPNITSEQLAGVITSGKTIQALYWGLTVRCDEKMLAWGHGLRRVAETIIEGGRLYPECAKEYLEEESLPDIPVRVLVENNYPIPEDVKEEKEIDMLEVEAQLRSKKSYIKRHRKLSDQEADAELEQIKKEQDMFENSLARSYTGAAGSETDEESEEETQTEESNDNVNENTDQEKEEAKNAETENRK